ncbi:MAG: metal-dependent hydrolase [Nitrospirales bacterium]
MASAFGHVAVAYALGKTIQPPLRTKRFWWLTAACCVLPDADVIGLFLGIPYEHVLGHRGLTHSLLFAGIIGILLPRMAVPDLVFESRTYGILVLFFFGVTMSHGILDAMTDGGLGIAFFAPFDSARYFFPWRPITVSPIGISSFFSTWGLGVLWSELLWIGIPVGLWLGALRVNAWIKWTNKHGNRPE